MASDDQRISTLGEKATHTRYWVVVFAVALAILSYIDRVLMSQAMPGPKGVAAELGLESWQRGYIFGAFAIAYALFEIPGGWMGDWLGPRRVLLRVVIWWSCFTALIGAAWSFASLVVIQFLFGAGEAGCFPNLTKAFSVWLQTHERVKMQRHHVDRSALGGRYHATAGGAGSEFRQLARGLPSFGSLGIIWAICSFVGSGITPANINRECSGTGAAWRGHRRPGGGHADVPWRKLISSRTVWLLWVQYFCLCSPGISTSPGCPSSFAPDILSCPMISERLLRSSPCFLVGWDLYFADC